MGPKTSVPEIDVTDIDLLDVGRFASGVPHEWFTWLRQHAPIAHHPEPNGPGFYVFSRHEDAVAVGKDAEHFSMAKPRVFPTGLLEDPPEFELMMEYIEGSPTILNMDPPEHTRHRLIVNRGFTPRMIGRLRDSTQDVASRLVTDALEQGEVDGAVDLAAGLPLTVIAELLGVPEADRPHVYQLVHGVTDGASPIDAMAELCSYAQRLADRARQDPKDDIITALLSPDRDGHELTPMEFNIFFYTLFAAGSDTTRNALSYGMHAFLDRPEEYERLAADPSLVDSATEEILRWASPAMFMRRSVAANFEYKGVSFRAGDKVSIWWVSANRDEDVFADPFRFDIGRTPNPHVAFGSGGPHFCLGAHLARLEIGVFLSELVRRVRSLESLGAPAFGASNFRADVDHLPLRLHAC